MGRRIRLGWRWLRRYVVYRTSHFAECAPGDNFPALPCAQVRALCRLTKLPSR